MNRDECLYLWAQWGILNSKHHEKLIEFFGDLQVAWRKITPSFLVKLGFNREKAERVFAIREQLDFEDMMRTMQRFKIRLIYLEDKDYPKPLKQIARPPVFLFVRGQLPAWHKAIAVVGTRKMTDYGAHCVEHFVPELVRNGFVIVSGLAMGVDALAHRLTLKSQGLTVAVLGSGVDLVTPYRNQCLGQEILASGGAIVSEFPLGTEGAPHHFPQRNRIIAGLCTGTLVIEGDVQSGALITARRALEENRHIFAVPHAITRKGLSGTNKIIRKSEAKLVENVAHILEDYNMQNSSSARPLVFSAFQKELLGHLVEDGKSIDELASITPYNVARLSEALITLQLKGVVREVGQKWVLL